METQPYPWRSRPKSSPENRWKHPALLPKENLHFQEASRPQANQSTSLSLSFPTCEMTVTHPIAYIARLNLRKDYAAVSPAGRTVQERWVRLKTSPLPLPGTQGGQMNSCPSWGLGQQPQGGEGSTPWVAACFCGGPGGLFQNIPGVLGLSLISGV